MIKNLKASEIAQQLDLPDGSAVVLLDRLAKGRRFSKEEQARNIFAVDANGNLLWQVHSCFDTEGTPFTKLHFENDTLTAYRWDGGSYQIDTQTGAATPLILER
ncbi:hypothetical protein [Hyphomonas jannaschiana]|uniref:Uncharacterized protein n=1 Tax=Hyphomonas jannaschiana VP2 TaxID=1280952 RepID=A0A059FEM6_9PROT|nr:hypothetical protein [Hyphomonas jannaschiana]KCZ89069.1 hypothetical protein HJA_07227 [Hyphomonas jannaschiana VP2]